MSSVALLLIIGGLVAAIAEHVLADETWGWLAWLARAIVKRASLRLATSRRARYQEEWLAELAQFDDRRLAGIAWALGVWFSAGSMKTETSESLEPARPETEFPAVLSARQYVVEEWHDFVAPISGAAFGDVEVEARIQAATARFEERLFADVGSPALDRIAELRTNNRARREAAAAQPMLARHAAEPGFFDRAPLPPIQRLPRHGPGGAVDPEWTIAPLTAAERRKAEPSPRTRQSRFSVASDGPERAQCGRGGI